MFRDEVLYQGFRTEILGRVTEDVYINVYVTIGGNGNGVDIIEFYRIVFSLVVESRYLRHYGDKKASSFKSESEVVRVSIISQNPDFVAVMAPGMIIHGIGKPKVNKQSLLEDKDALFVEIHEYNVMRPADVVNPETGELFSGVSYGDPFTRFPVMYYVRNAYGQKFRRAGSDFKPNNTNMVKRMPKNSNLKPESNEDK